MPSSRPDSDTGLKLLAVGDLHLGRRPTRLPEDLAGMGGDFGPGQAWERLVNRAIEEGVEAVALAGDVVDREDHYYEAYRQLQAGVMKLTEAGIRVLGVVGNHDVAVLPRLADQIPEFELLGRDGQWECSTIHARGESVHLWGWSFPAPRVTDSPLAGHVFELRPDGPNLGLLHCDRDQPGSAYAPVGSRELESAGLDGWLLGHIHRPDALAAPHPNGYLGSVTGLHPGEYGDRGPWLIRVRAGRIESMDQWIQAPLRYARLDLDLTELDEPEQARGHLLEAVRDLDKRLATLDTPPEATGLRIRLTGRCRFGEAVLDLFSDDDRAHLFSSNGGSRYFVEQLVSATRPEIDLEKLAREPTPPGLLARKLLLLDEPDENAERQSMIDQARHRLREQAGKSRWNELSVDPPDPISTAEYLRESGLRLLERLLAQRQEET